MGWVKGTYVAAEMADLIAQVEKVIRDEAARLVMLGMSSADFRSRAQSRVYEYPNCIWRLRQMSFLVTAFMVTTTNLHSGIPGVRHA